MFSSLSFRRKPAQGNRAPVTLHGSPSLPDLSEQGIRWPDSLVSFDDIREDASPNKKAYAAKTTLPPSTPFHRPFKGDGNGVERGPISSIYMSTPSSPYSPNRKPSATAKLVHKRARAPPTFNVMVAGGRGTGKTSLLRLILDTAEFSPNATADQRAAVEKFLHGNVKKTRSVNTACVEILESRYDRCLLTVIDTPGIEFGEGRELTRDRQVNSIVRYFEAQYADTMSEESKLVRSGQGDRHVHLCIYMIDPNLVTPASSRRDPLLKRSRSEETISKQLLPDLVPDTSDDSDDDENTQLCMSAAEIRVIRRIGARANILPVIAHADTLTDAKLNAVKDAVRRGLEQAGIDWGVFDDESNSKTSDSSRGEATPTETEKEVLNEGAEEDDVDEEEEEEERPSRQVIKLRPSRHASTRALSRSRSRRNHAISGDYSRPVPLDIYDEESLANIRFSLHTVGKSNLTTLMPFAVISPESKSRPNRLQERSVADTSAPSDEAAPPVPPSPKKGRGEYVTPESLKGVFVRKFRWGQVDCLNPEHCDFPILRSVIFSTHLKVLKTHTREVLYEKYRTERLLVSQDERQKLLDDLGL